MHCQTPVHFKLNSQSDCISYVQRGHGVPTQRASYCWKIVWLFGLIYSRVLPWGPSSIDVTRIAYSSIRTWIQTLFILSCNSQEIFMRIYVNLFRLFMKCESRSEIRDHMDVHCSVCLHLLCYFLSYFNN